MDKRPCSHELGSIGVDPMTCPCGPTRRLSGPRIPMAPHPKSTQRHPACTPCGLAALRLQIPTAGLETQAF